LTCTKIAPIISEKTKKQGIKLDTKLIEILTGFILVTCYSALGIDRESIGFIGEGELTVPRVRVDKV